MDERAPHAFRKKALPERTGVPVEDDASVIPMGDHPRPLLCKKSYA